MSKPNAKETVRKLLDDLPEDTSLEDIQYHIYVREKIERGLQDVQDGRVLEQDEVERRMAKWLGGGNGTRAPGAAPELQPRSSLKNPHTFLPPSSRGCAMPLRYRP